MKQIGEVSVDSGRIRIGDPEYIADRPDLCCETDTQLGDGVYPVYELEIEAVKFIAVNLNPNNINWETIFNLRKN